MDVPHLTIRKVVAPLTVALFAVLLTPAAAANQFRWLRWAPRTVLVTPAGRPVAISLQRSLDDAAMPTYRGTMVVDVSTRDSHRYCDWAPGSARVIDACTYAPGDAPNLADTPLADMPETVIDPNSSMVPEGGIDTLLIYEQGRVVDTAYLTSGMRARLISLFDGPPAGDPEVAWFAGEEQYSGGSTGVYPPGEEFSQVYWTCATRRYQEAALDVDVADGRSVCRMIQRMLQPGTTNGPRGPKSTRAIERPSAGAANASG